MFAVIVLAIVGCITLASTAAELKILHNEWDFGSIEQGLSKQATFFIQNAGRPDEALQRKYFKVD